MSLHNLSVGGTAKSFADIKADDIECNNLSISNALNVQDLNVLGNTTGIALNNLDDVSYVAGPNNGEVLTYDSLFQEWQNKPISAGEVNTASNVGVGVGQVFKQKTGADLEFKTVIAGQNMIVTNNADEVSVAVDSILAGTYGALTTSNVVNCNILSNWAATVLRIGNTVHVTGHVHLNTLTVPSAFGFDVTVPVARSGNFSTTNQVQGCATIAGVDTNLLNNHAGNSNGLAQGFCSGVIGTQNVRLQWAVSSIVSTTFAAHFSFSYRI